MSSFKPSLASLKTIFHHEDFHLLLEKFPEPICILSTDEDEKPHQFIYANKRTEELFGFSADFICTYTWEEMFGIPRDADLQKFSDKSQNTPYEYKESPLEETMKGKSLKINIREVEGVEKKKYIVMTIIDTTEHQKTRNELKRTTSEFESLFLYNPDILFSIDKTGLFTNMNVAGLTRLSYSTEEIGKTSFRDLIVKEHLDRTNQHFYEVIKGNVQEFQICIQDKFKNPFPIDVTAVPIIIDQEITGLIGIARDISESIALDEKLRASEESYRALFDHNIDPVLTFDLEGNFLAVNEATETILGVQRDQLIGEPFLPFIDPELHEETWNHFSNVLKGQPYQYETSLHNADGEQVLLHITLIPAMFNDTITHIHCIGKDVTHLRKHEELMEYMAYHDNLTGLGNQRLFSKTLQQLIDERVPCSVWIVDLDRFKFVNDHLGHEAGDRLLTDTANRIQSLIAEFGTIYRYGGDEFAILIRDIPDEELTNLAKKIGLEIAKPYNLNGFHSVVTASLGISKFPIHGSDQHSLVRAADHAMYHAKRQGRNAFQLYNNGISGLATSDFKMESLLREAIEKKEFVLHYQPQYDVKTLEIHGVETLIRWNSKELGMVSPADFIPLAEETGTIVEIGEWVIKEACRQNVEWQRRGLMHVPVSVNLSLRQFYQVNLVDKIAAILQETGLAPELLMLEITESIAMQEDIAIQVLQDLKALGVLIAMDDFGTGYSSLKYLHSFPIDHLKIDQAFTQNLENKEGLAIVTTIINLGKSLGICTVAEGVETSEQSNVLKELGCDIYQGYYYGKPLEAQALERHVQGGQK
ncbi:EAL and GGDEF domain-containing protein [Paenisporosarcina cavernae]|uniref:EAL domain-containing protein n=1 Tax=Paenisporosarcina cavernae TaxID=2320858 RepID=A0A385YUJ1_9BACL|nr:EAL domain-containing protein [Paenisporosarcina cavernae]AYC30529.1 EAL domain-containing protein [Paenisporosarcina cavernae]